MKSMLESNSKGIRTTLMRLIWCLYFWLSIDFTQSSDASIGDFELVSVDSVDEMKNGTYFGPQR